MPIVGFLTKGIDVAKLSYTPKVPEGMKLEPPTLAYGAFLQSVIDFMIIAAAIFVVVKIINTAKERFEMKKDEKPAVTPEDILLLREIRDSLKKS
jgi:large conductance mechanosensitive channel